MTTGRTSMRFVYYICILFTWCAGAAGCLSVPGGYRAFSFAPGGPTELDAAITKENIPEEEAISISPPPHAEGWEIADTALADVTGDGREELLLVVWRPWRDWPIMRWLGGESPIGSFHDRDGKSCHLIVLEPDTGDEIWAGSALPFPIRDMAAGDLDGDGISEVATLRGEYDTKGCCASRFADIWEWEDMGFVMKWEPIPGRFSRLAVIDCNHDGTDELVLW